ncbi:acyl carrier protein [Undibacterium parvum]|uniref:Acyl carrier protein n=1 Tax=Undibacterium parvum TaxID=401471 RepID=A0A3S9HK30_9BURK|nr:phosphopantetheine-binding protein [Undibacterium parvum]AZP12460.1 acyl carrier protein [Undibacterium parvum]
MNSIDTVKRILIDVLNLGITGQAMNAESHLLGAYAELDSIAVISLISRLEEHFGFDVEDDEINGQVFETLGTLSTFVDSKLI